MVNKKNRQGDKGGLKISKGAGIKNIRKILIASGALAALSIVVLILFYAFVFGGHVEVMRVNGQPVTRDEFRFYMEKERSGVSSYFYQTYGVSADEEFWTKTYGGERPADVLREKAREACIYDKTLQALALKYGVTKDISFSGFQRQLEKVNREREESSKRGETLYGVVRFTEMQYYMNVTSTLKTELQDKLENVEVKVQDSEVKALYDERFDVYNNNNNITVAELHIPYITDFMSPDAIQSNEKALPVGQAYDLIFKIKQQLDEGADFNKLCETNTGEKPVEMTIALDEASKDPSTTSGIIARNTAGLQKGGYSEPFENGLGFSIIKMVDVGVKSSISYSDAHDNLYGTVLARKYGDYLTEQARKADVAIRTFPFNLIGH